MVEDKKIPAIEFQLRDHTTIVIPIFDSIEEDGKIKGKIEFSMAVIKMSKHVRLTDYETGA